jgi:gluconate 2-dehydrogenase gamma chain
MPNPGPKAVPLTRRQFVAAGAAGGAIVAVGCSPGKLVSWEFLSEGQARALGAICDEIVPADDFPSASQAGVLHYIDGQLVRHYRRHRDAYTEGLERAAKISRDQFGRELAALDPPQRLEIVSAIEHDDHTFFNLVRNHTMEGYYGSPRHGGNRDAVSWRMLGLDEPPLHGRAQYDLGKEPPR